MVLRYVPLIGLVAVVLALAASSPHVHAEPAIIDDFGDNAIGDVWNEGGSGTGASVSETNQQIEFHFDADSREGPTPPGGSFGDVSARLTHDCKVAGDFDLQVDFDLTQWPTENGVRLALVIDGFSVQRDWDAIFGNVYVGGIGGVAHRVDTTATSGKLRLSRADTTVTASYGTGGGWATIASGAGDDKPTTLQLSAWTHNHLLDARPEESEMQDITVTLDNLKLEEGTLSCNEVESVEFTQAIQELQTVEELMDDLAGDGKPPVPVIAGKPAVMRVYFDEVTQTTTRKVEVTGDVTGSETLTLDTGCDAEKRRNQEGGCQSADFHFTPPEDDWEVTVNIYDDDELREHYDFELTSVPATPFTVTYLPICVVLTPGASPTCPSIYVTSQVSNLMEKIFPVSPDDFSYRRMPVPAVDLNAPLASNAEESQLIADLRFRYELLSLGNNLSALSGDQLAGWLPNGGAATGTLGISDPVWLGSTGRVTWQIDTSGSTPVDAEFTLAHEVGHNVGLRHTNQGDGCGASDASTDWPHADSTIQEVGFDVGEKKAVPETKFSVMSYCSPPGSNIWISPFTYKKLAEGGLQPQAARTDPSGAASQYLLIKGTAQADGSGGSIDEAFVIDSTIASPPSNPLGNHCLYLTGGAQMDYCFNLTFTKHRTNTPLDEEAFVLRVPLPPGTTKAYLMRGSEELAAMERSSSAPTVEISQPQVGAEWRGEQTIEWTASDADGGAMSFVVLYSPDGGANWLPIEVDSSDTEFTFDTRDLEGDEIMLRVLASDGLNTSEAMVGPITLLDAIKGDVDCDGDVDSVDALKGLQHTAGIPVVQPGGCPPIGSGGAGAIFGDVDCDDDVDSVDSLSVLRDVAGLAAILPPGCKPIGI